MLPVNVSRRDASNGEGSAAMIGLLMDDEIDALLFRLRVGRLACSANDQPYVTPINYRYDGVFIIGCSMVGRMITVLREQSLACFEIDEIDGVGWRSVIVAGRYEEVTDARARRAALRLLGVGDEGSVSRSLTATGHLVVFRLRPTEKSGRFERRAA